MGGLLFHIIIPSFALLFGFHVHKQIIFFLYLRSSPIVKNDGASQEHMLQNTLILRGQEAVRIMLKGFLCLTQPAFTRRPWRDNALPRRRVGALLCFDIILTDSRPLRTADFASVFLRCSCLLVVMQILFISELDAHLSTLRIQHPALTTA